VGDSPSRSRSRKRLASGARSRPDFGRTADDYATYRAEVPAELFDRLARGYGVGLAGQRVLDLGTGTGAVARALARRGCEVTGLDPSPELLVAAARLADEEGLAVRFVRGVAEAIEFPKDSFDIVTAAVCWHWFDGERAASEIRRVLAPGGRLVIVHFNWLSRPGNVVEATEALMRRELRIVPGMQTLKRLVKGAVARIRPAWVRGLGTGIHPESMSTLTAAGFANLESFSFDVDVPYDHQAWRGRVRSHAYLGASRSPSSVARFDTRLAALLWSKFAHEPMSIPHRIFAIVARNAVA
jgi:ubiquinone/menaquinone biosynthesis C-methylase UbiE